MIRFGDIEIELASGTICHRGVEIILNNGPLGCLRRKLLCHMVLAGPQTFEQMFEALYGDDPDGGPESGVKIINVMLKQLEPALKQAGLRIAGEGWKNQRQHYRIEPIV